MASRDSCTHKRFGCGRTESFVLVWSACLVSLQTPCNAAGLRPFFLALPKNSYPLAIFSCLLYTQAFYHLKKFTVCIRYLRVCQEILTNTRRPGARKRLLLLVLGHLYAGGNLILHVFLRQTLSWATDTYWGELDCGYIEEPGHLGDTIETVY
jgi:hypothetical protein